MILEKMTALAAVILLCLCMAAPLKRTAFVRNRPWIGKMTGFHTAYGILLPVVGIIHGILAGGKPGMMTGKAVFVLLLVLLVLTVFQKKMRPAIWRRLHCRLAAAVCALAAVHIVWALVM